MDEWRSRHSPLVVVSARGASLQLADGSQLLDGNSSWWVATLGHNHPRLVAALKAQADRLCHVSLGGITHAPAALLAEELSAVAPAGLTEVFFSDDGSTAVEAAVKMAVQYQTQSGHPERTTFLSLSDAFHGETVGATSLGGVEVFRRPFAGIVFDVVHVRPPASDAELPQALRALAEAINQHGRSLAEAVELLELSNRRSEETTAARQSSLEGLVTTLDLRTNDFEQRLQRFSSLLDESLDSATTRTREIASLIA